MITKPTVLVLGAGASADYSFPTGRGLLVDMCNQGHEGGTLYRSLVDTGMRRDDIKLFIETLHRSAAPSVDLFLEHRKDFEEIGKIAIAAMLIPHEKYDGLLSAKNHKQGWYQTLFDLMIEGGKFEENALSIITFNYDRSLEAFFFQALQNLYGLTENEAESALAKIPIVHLHGSLGSKLTSTGQERGYQPHLREDWTRAAAKQIKIVHEIKPGKEFERAFKLLFPAEEIIFLGFGFHPVNVQRLRLSEASEAHASFRGKTNNEQCWLACRYGMLNGELERAKAHLRGLDIRFGDNPQADIDMFIKSTPCLIPKGVEQRNSQW